MSRGKKRVRFERECILSQHNGKLPLPRWKQGNYLVILIHGGRYCLNETINCSSVRSSGGGTFLFVCISDSAPNYIYSCSSSSMSFLIYVSICFVFSDRGKTTMWQVLYVGINPRDNCITRSFFSTHQLFTCKDLENTYWGYSMHPKNILEGYITC